MNILFINKNENSGGAAQVCQELIFQFEKLNHNVSFFVKNKESKKNNVIEIKNKHFKKVLAYLTSNDLDYYYGNEILKTEEFKKADIVNLHDISGHFFKLSTIKRMSALKPVIWTFHDMQPINHYFGHSLKNSPSFGFFTGSSPKLISNILWWNHLYLKLRKWNIYKKSNFTIISPSIWLRNKILQTKIKNKEIVIINNGINGTVFSPHSKSLARKKLGLPENKKIILSIANGGKKNTRKGWRYILKIKDYLKKEDIIVINIGNKKTWQENNIKFYSTIRDQKKLSLFYQAADLLLFPSLADNFPMTIIESMACGTPVVAFNTGGIKEQVDHKINGYLAYYQDNSDLMKGIKFIYSSNYKDLSKKCRDKVLNNFTSKIMAQKYINLYNTKIKEYKNSY